MIATDLYIAGTGKHLPGPPVDNEQIHELFGIPADWIEGVLGIHARHLAMDLCTRRATTTVAEMAAQAAKQAMCQAEMRPEQIQLLILATNSPDRLAPPIVAFTQEHLAIPTCTALQLHGGCSTPLQGVVTALQFLETGAVDTALVMGSEMLSVFAPRGSMNAMERVSSSLFGDGAGAILLTRRPPGIPIHVLATHCVSTGVGRPPALFSAPLAETLTEGKPLRFVHDYEVVRTEAPAYAADAVRALMGKAGVELSATRVIPNQPSPRMIAQVAVHLGVDPAQVYVDCDRLGNTNAASILIALHDAIGMNWLKHGDVVALVTVEVSKWLQAAVCFKM
jgi:3-oxoacyl-[acyl-carrier-protein] synthase-3